MTDTSQHFAEADFRVGRVLSRTFSVLSRNLLPFCLVTVIAALPNLLIFAPSGTRAFAPATLTPGASAVRLLLGFGLVMMLNALSQAIVLYGAFEDMRGRPVHLLESLRIGLRRFFPVLGVAIGVAVLTALAGILLVIPAFIVATMLLVAMPACVVEQLGPANSMSRSRQLTKGHRWKIFGLWLLAMFVSGILQSVLIGLASIIGGPILALIVFLAWSAIFGAFYAIMVVVIYHDLRVTKEGVDTDQIAAVFD
jgi:MFS family permease